ncbi:MAG: Tyrosine-protein kinase etk [Candidatus Omnitrophica bacterium]|nr:Tyrosine-protein kinase etk [Candidatus Omnitrophota bacterium]
MADELLSQEPLGLDSSPVSALADYWRIILGNIRLVLLITCGVMALSVVRHSMMPNKYAATANILVEKTDQRSKSYDEVIMPSFRGEEDYYGTQIAILTGRKIRQAVSEELKLQSGYSVEARRVRGTRIISVSATHTDPQMSAAIANKIAEVYIRQSGEESLFISKQLLELFPDEYGPTADKKDGFNRQEFVENLSSVGNDPIVSKLRGQKLEVEVQLKELSQRYRSEHPQIKELSERLSFIEAEMAQRIQSITTNVKASLKGEIKISNVRVLEEAQVPRRPSAPNRVVGVTVHTLLALFGSVVLVLGLEYTNQKIRSEEDLQNQVHIPFLGYIPLARDISRNKKNRVKGAPPTKASTVEMFKQNGALNDAVASVRTHILFSMPYEKSKRIMFTSCIPDEGKTTVAVLLALSLTGLGRKILLIDADMRRPFIHAHFNMSGGKGLTDYLIGTATVEEIVRDVPGTELRLIPGGNPTPNPTELLSSDRFRELLEEVSPHYDRIVIDVPPSLYIPDGLVVAKHVHSGVLVCGSGMVHKKTVLAVKEKFASIGHAFIGAVINRANYEGEGYRYRYYSTYKAYYVKNAKK